MNDSPGSRTLFWSSEGPLSSLACAGLLVISSGRFAYALIAGMALVFVYLFSVLSLSAGRFLVSDRIRGAVSVVLSACYGAVYLLLISTFSPLLAQETAFFISLAPIVFTASGIADRSYNDSIADAVVRTGSESASILALLMAFALVREPIGYGALSLPGRDGIAIVFGSKEASAFAARAVAIPVGGFLLIGYAVVAFRKLRSRGNGEGSEREEA